MAKLQPSFVALAKFAVAMNVARDGLLSLVYNDVHGENAEKLANALTKIIDAPHEEKWRRLNATNGLLCVQGVTDLLGIVGFVPDDTHLTLPPHASLDMLKHLHVELLVFGDAHPLGDGHHDVLPGVPQKEKKIKRKKRAIHTIAS